MMKYFSKIILGGKNTNLIRPNNFEMDRRYIDGYRKLWIENIRDYTP